MYFMFQRHFARRLQLAAANLEVSGFVMVTMINGGPGQLSGDNLYKQNGHKRPTIKYWQHAGMRAHSYMHANTHTHTHARTYTSANDYIFFFLVWGDWTQCTKPCGNGTQDRYKVCGPTNVTCSKIVVGCNMKPCNGKYLRLLNILQDSSFSNQRTFIFHIQGVFNLPGRGFR